MGGFGIVFGTAGVLILTLALPAARVRADAAESLPVVSVVGARDHRMGARVLLEASIAADAPTPFGEFVAFSRSEFRGWKDEGARRREQWAMQEVVAPPLTLADAGATLLVVNAGYDMQREPHTWQSTETLEHAMFGASTQRVVGFHRGDRVTLEGVLDDGDTGRVIQAAVLAGGGSADYVASLQGEVPTLRILGSIFSGVGLLMAVLGVVVARRTAR